MNVSMMGLDLAKNVFQVHGSDTAGAVVFRKQLRRDKVLAFFCRTLGLHRRDGSLLQRALLGT